MRPCSCKRLPVARWPLLNLVLRRHVPEHMAWPAAKPRRDTFCRPLLLRASSTALLRLGWGGERRAHVSHAARLAALQRATSHGCQMGAPPCSPFHEGLSSGLRGPWHASQAPLSAADASHRAIVLAATGCLALQMEGRMVAGVGACGWMGLASWAGSSCASQACPSMPARRALCWQGSAAQQRQSTAQHRSSGGSRRHTRPPNGLPSQRQRRRRPHLVAGVCRLLPTQGARQLGGQTAPFFSGVALLRAAHLRRQGADWCAAAGLAGLAPAKPGLHRSRRQQQPAAVARPRRPGAAFHLASCTLAAPPVPAPASPPGAAGPGRLGRPRRLGRCPRCAHHQSARVRPPPERPSAPIILASLCAHCTPKRPGAPAIQSSRRRTPLASAMAPATACCACRSPQRPAR
jgi:hypothetical protein